MMKMFAESSMGLARNTIDFTDITDASSYFEKILVPPIVKIKMLREPIQS